MKIHIATRLLAVIALAAIISQPLSARAQSTAFAYQGRLDDSGNPANGSYELKFSIYESVSGGVQQGNSLTTSTAVSNGLFTVTLDFGNQFPGADRWLEVAVRTNGGGAFDTLTPRQPLTSTPYAITARTLISGGLAPGTYGSAVTFNNTGNSFTGNGAGVTNVNAVTLGGLAAVSFWKTGGNAGANPTNGAFLGSTDNLPVEFRVNGTRVLRLEPVAPGVIGLSSAPSIIGGWEGNRITNGAIGATVWGGGGSSFSDAQEANVVGADYGTVSGGRLNTAGGAEATVAGGRANTATGGNATIGGGYANTVIGSHATIGGGTGNTVDSELSTISGGDRNVIHSNAVIATISGGALNEVRTNAWRGTVGGGNANTVGAPEGTVAGGAFNHALGFAATVGGGGGNTAGGEWSTIAGGRDNVVTNADYATIGGGSANIIQPGAVFATIPGGYLNSAVSYSFAAGRRAKASHTGAFIWADSTDADFVSTANNQFLVRAGGGVGINKNNPATALDVNGTVTASGFSGVGAGLTSLNAANLTGTILDARLSANVAIRSGGNSFTGNQTIAGSVGIGIAPQSTLHVNGTARIQGADNWDVNNTEGDFRVGNDTQRFKIGVATGGGGAGDVWMRAQGGTARVFIKTPGGTTFFSNEGQTAGVSLAGNGTAWAVVSDRNVKKDIAPVDPRAILEKLAAMPITQWHYQWEPADVTPHIGPMAQDFKAAFYPGTDDKSITTQEADGVALAAIQGLDQKVEGEVAALRAENVALKARLERLENLLR